MQLSHSQYRLQKCRPGFLLLMLLISVAIGAVIYCLHLSALLCPRLPPKYCDPNASPWEETFLLTNDTLQAYGVDPETVPSAEQPKITRTIRFRGQVYEGRYRRGELEFRIRSDGRINGSWSADFETTSPPIHYTPSAGRTGVDFEGNIAPSKIYQDEYGQDPSKLYMITRAIPILKAHNLENNKVDTMCVIYLYVTGWIDTEYKAFGKLTMTSHERPPKSCLIFDWQGSRID